MNNYNSRCGDFGRVDFLRWTLALPDQVFPSRSMVCPWNQCGSANRENQDSGFEVDIFLIHPSGHSEFSWHELHTSFLRAHFIYLWMTFIDFLLGEFGIQPAMYYWSGLLFYIPHLFYQIHYDNSLNRETDTSIMCPLHHPEYVISGPCISFLARRLRVFVGIATQSKDQASPWIPTWFLKIVLNIRRSFGVSI